MCVNGVSVHTIYGCVLRPVYVGGCGCASLCIGKDVCVQKCVCIHMNGCVYKYIWFNNL